MATNTKNYKLTKPDATDLVDIDVLNENFDVIDTRIKANADAAASKQDPLTFDDKPTKDSTNPATSGGIFAALEKVQESLVFDDAPEEGSENPVKSRGIKAALDEKQVLLTTVPEVEDVTDEDYIFLERNGEIFKCLAEKILLIGDLLKTEAGEILTTESGENLMFDVAT